MKCFRLILCIVFAIIICFPFGTMFLFMDETNAEYEEYVQEEPLTLDEAFSTEGKGLKKNIQTYLTQHVAKRQPVISSWAKLLYDIDVPANRSIVIGKDKMLFYNSTVQSKRGIEPVNSKRIPRELNSLEMIRNFCGWSDVEFVFCLAPDKETIYPEKLPAWYTKTGEKNHREAFIAGYKAGDYTFNLLDYSDPLIGGKEKYGDLLYPDTDSHWTQLGAYLAYKYTLENLEQKYEPVEINDYRVRQSEGYSTARLLGIYMDDVKDFSTDISYDNAANDTLYPTIFLGHPVWQSYRHLENEDALYDASVLILMDSYTAYNLEFYQATFSDVHIVHYDEILYNTEGVITLKKLVHGLLPDVVIFEMVERSLGDLYDMNREIVK